MAVSRLSAFAAGAVFALVLGGGTAVAATGGKFILGKSNSATTTTTLTNTKGTALALNSKAGTPPLKVNNGTRVTNLNADRLDGLDASSFARTSGKTGSFDQAGQFTDVDDDGVADFIVAVATCPPGTQMTGGGVADYTSSGYVFLNGPGGGESWMAAVSYDPSAGEVASDVEATVVCYSPTGSVPGSYRMGSTSGTLSAEMKAKLARAVAARR